MMSGTLMGGDKRRMRVSLAELACTVPKLPECPVFMAANMV